MSNSSPEIPRITIPARVLWIAGAVILIGLLAAHYAWAASFWSQTVFFLRMQAPWLIPLILFLVVAAWLIPFYVHRVTTDRDAYGYMRRSSSSDARARSRSIGFVLYPLAFILLVGVFAFPTYINYQRAHWYASATTEVNDESLIDFQMRTPYDVAAKSSRNAVGDVTGGDIDSIKYTASAEGSEFTILMRDRDGFDGYVAVVDLNGERCMFSEAADRRVGGPFNHSLTRLVHKEKRYVYFNDNDVYGYCDGDTPYVVAPLTRIEGFWTPHLVPAGVAVYNGETGDLKIYDEVEVGEIPGPVYPQSLSAEVRESLTASGTWWEYIRNRVGYITTVNDEEDPNSGNRSEYGLQDSNGEGYYVTPLVVNGSSTSISALGIQQYGSVKAGELNDYKIVRYDNVQDSNGQVASNIRAKFSSLDWQNGMDIYEVTPLKGNERIATLGLNQAMQYRVSITEDQYCLQDSKGEQIRCVAVGDSGTEVPDEVAPGTELTGDLSSLSDEELVDLLSQIATEQKARMESSTK